MLPVLALPFTAALGSETYAREAAVGATVDPGGARQSGYARAEWRLADGTVREGRVGVEAGLPAGSEVDIWVDAAGNEVGEPMTPETVAWNAVAVTMTAWFAVVVACGLGFWLVRRVLDSRRYRSWQEEWQRLGAGEGV